MTYAVVDHKEHLIVEDGFKTRTDAKKVRNDYNKKFESETRFTVTNGAKHPNGPSPFVSTFKSGKPVLPTPAKKKEAKTEVEKPVTKKTKKVAKKKQTQKEAKAA